MRKTKLLAVILCLVLVLSIFAGCQSSGMDATQGTNPSTEHTQLTEATVPSDDVTEPSGEATEPSSEVTEPSSEVTEPTETVYPRTIEAIKSHMTPYITFSEACALFGGPDDYWGNTLDKRIVTWYLEDDYYVSAWFYDTTYPTLDQYLESIPCPDTNPDGTYVGDYLWIWFNNMVCYRAYILKSNPAGGPAETVEVLFEFAPPWSAEEAS